MIESLVLWGRALGIALAAIPAFLVAMATQFCLILWRTAVLVWIDRPDPRSPQQIQADKETAKAEHQVEEAHKRQLEHVRKLRGEGSVVGAINEWWEKAKPTPKNKGAKK